MQNVYKYDAYLQYTYNGKDIVFDNTNILSFSIEYDYDNKNMPIILLIAAIDKKIVDDMITNKNKKIIFNVTRFIENSNMQFKRKYIYKEFTYFISGDLNNTDDLDYETNKNPDVYRKITIGLMDQELIDNNKKIVNEIAKDTTLINLLATHLSHMKLLIEPVNPVKIDNLLIPYMNTISNFVKYLNDNYAIYDTKYRLFYDFDKTYLLSSSGKVVESTDDDINTVVINIVSNTDENNGIQGMYTDEQRKMHILDIVINNITMSENESEYRSYDNIISIDSMGNTSTASIGSTFNTNTKIVRTNIPDYASKVKNEIANSSILLSVIKEGIDTTVLTMNKQYIVQNYDRLKDKDRNGIFILSKKREIYTRDGEDYSLNCVLSLRKAMS